mmetsp:Transcript_26105/g.85660  ORF Transcript_26105/g.85660 Transcript_26105/m.85660 type:complete len:225 (-) Transcript_26105:476-1150(-)
MFARPRPPLPLPRCTYLAPRYLSSLVSVSQCVRPSLANSRRDLDACDLAVASLSSFLFLRSRRKGASQLAASQPADPNGRESDEDGARLVYVGVGQDQPLPVSLGIVELGGGCRHAEVRQVLREGERAGQDVEQGTGHVEARHPRQGLPAQLAYHNHVAQVLTESSSKSRVPPSSPAHSSAGRWCGAAPAGAPRNARRPAHPAVADATAPRVEGRRPTLRASSS